MGGDSIVTACARERIGKARRRITLRSFIFSMRVEAAQGTVATRVRIQLSTTDGHLYAARPHDKAFHALPLNKASICRSNPK